MMIPRILLLMPVRHYRAASIKDAVTGKGMIPNMPGTWRCVPY
ncbi:hypothetical protein DORFOR_01334 [Dorea formicigenerans ATCC 27755]|uniref:Uncharacterized protein n=1 Tax=Dorea formicigenerans ATCC 27755 TaxID=411461 RepID=B0G4Z4_9FIRM|nr:hypothetical protein DORFOR_01334 [Dorea formicigenerans ATCC 27755]